MILAVNRKSQIWLWGWRRADPGQAAGQDEGPAPGPDSAGMVRP